MKTGEPEKLTFQSQSKGRNIKLNPRQDFNPSYIGGKRVLIFTFMRFLWAAVKEGVPSNDELEYLSVKVNDWENRGRRLKFTKRLA